MINENHNTNEDLSGKIKMTPEKKKVYDEFIDYMYELYRIYAY